MLLAFNSTLSLHANAIDNLDSVYSTSRFISLDFDSFEEVHLRTKRKWTMVVHHAEYDQRQKWIVVQTPTDKFLSAVYILPIIAFSSLIISNECGDLRHIDRRTRSIRLDRFEHVPMLLLFFVISCVLLILNKQIK